MRESLFTIPLTPEKLYCNKQPLKGEQLPHFHFRSLAVTSCPQTYQPLKLESPREKSGAYVQ